MFRAFVLRKYYGLGQTIIHMTQDVKWELQLTQSKTQLSKIRNGFVRFLKLQRP